MWKAAHGASEVTRDSIAQKNRAESVFLCPMLFFMNADPVGGDQGRGTATPTACAPSVHKTAAADSGAPLHQSCAKKT